MKKVMVSDFVARKFDTPCEVVGKNGESVGILVDTGRYRQLLASHDIGTASGHMTALAIVPESRADRSARMKKLLASADAKGKKRQKTEDDEKRRRKRRKPGRPRARP